MRDRIIAEDIARVVDRLTGLHDRFEGRTILIAGGAGFLGRYLVLTLDRMNRTVLKDACRIILLDNFVSGLRDWIPDSPHITLLHQSASDPIDIEGSVDYVINAASIASPVFYNRLRLETIDAGILGTRNLLEFSVQKDVEAHLFISSSEVYGDPDEGHVPTGETYNGNVSCTGPRACYDEPKRMGETLCINYAAVHDLPICIARPFNVYGPGIRLDDGRVMPNFAQSALLGQELPVHGTGTKTRTFCYIADATVGFFQILLSSTRDRIFNIGNDTPEITIRDLADAFVRAARNDTAVVEHTDTMSDVYRISNPERRCPDLTRIKTQLGYVNEVPLDAGIHRFMAWVENALYHREDVRESTTCRVCASRRVETVLDLGLVPLANQLVEAGDEAERFPLRWMRCADCGFVQLSHVISPKRLFADYPYVTSTTRTFRTHFDELAERLHTELDLTVEDLAVDIGSNDGLLLGRLLTRGCRVQGVEPATSIAGEARQKGVDTIADFFGRRVVGEIVRTRGRARLVTATNVFAHTDLVHDMVENIKRLLTPDGVFVAEVQYILDTLMDGTFDNIYHEHVSYFSLSTLQRLLDQHDLSMYRAERIDTHGGSLRIWAARTEARRPVEPSVQELIEQEHRAGLDDIEIFRTFEERVHTVVDWVRDRAQESSAQDRELIGYGAPAKATTLLNVCGLTHEDMAFTVDDNPRKQGRMIPGTGIPIVSADHLDDRRHLDVMVLAWNFADEILENNRSRVGTGSRFYTALPQPRTLTD